MKKYKTIIIDDESEAQEVLSFLLSSYPEIKIKGIASNVDDGIVLTLKHKPDIIFLDIEMSIKNGFDFIHELKDFDINPTIIFVTAFTKYAVEAIKFAAFDYLLKPVESTELTKTIQRFKSNQREKSYLQQREKLFEKLNAKKVKLKTVNGFALVNPAEIAYCIADGNYANVFFKNGDKVFVSCYLSDIYDHLPSYDFFRISRSVVLNINFLQRVNRKNKKCQIVVNNKKIHFPISKRAILELEKSFKIE